MVIQWLAVGAVMGLLCPGPTCWTHRHDPAGRPSVWISVGLMSLTALVYTGPMAWHPLRV